LEHRLFGTLNKLIRPDLAKLPKIIEGLLPDPWMGEMPAEQYHADKERMSSSAVRKLLHSPRQFLASWTDMEVEDEEKEPDYFRFGRAAHAMLLEPEVFRRLHVVEPVFTGMTKDGRESTQSKEAKDKKKKWYEDVDPAAMIVTEKEMQSLLGMVESILEHKIACNLLQNGQPEMTIHWVDKETGISCKARPDYLAKDKSGGIHVIDFKTTRDIREGIFSDAIKRHKYFVQLAFYYDAVAAAIGREPESITIIAVEKTLPYECAVYPLEDSWLARGRIEYRHALNLYKKCMTENKWPAFQSTATMLNAPAYLQNETLPEFDFT